MIGIDEKVCLWDQMIAGLAGCLLLLLTPRSRARVHARVLLGSGLPVPPAMLATAQLGRAAGA